MNVMEFKYRAFISYSHADHGWAVWLHKALETYKVPKQVVGLTTPAGTVPKKLGRVYRDEAEEGAASELGPRIEAALESADAQIIIASPRSARSQWVDKEIRKYKSLGRETRIFVLIVDGEPHAKDPAQECFPDALKWKAGPDGELSDEPAEPLAVDVRKFGKHDALVRIAAGILGLGYDDLKQRDLQRQRAAQRQAQALFAGALALFTGAVIAGALSIGQTKNVADRESLLFADRALQYNQSADARRALLWATGGLPDPSMLIKGDDAQARTQFIHSYRDNIALDTEYIRSAAFNPDGKSFVTIDNFSSNAPSIWNMQGEKIMTLDIDSFESDSFLDIAYTDDGSLVYATTLRDGLRVWDTVTGDLVHVIAGDIISAIVFGADNDRVLVKNLRDETSVREISTDTVLTQLDGTGWGFEVSPDGTKLLNMGERQVYVYDAETYALLYTLEARDSLFFYAAFSPDNRWIVTDESYDGAVRIWDAQTGALLHTPSTPQQDPDDLRAYTYATPTGFSPDSSYLSFYYQEGIGYWRTDSWERVDLASASTREEVFDNGQPDNALLFSPDSKILYSISKRGHAEAWDLKNGRKIADVFREEMVTDAFEALRDYAALTPDGSRMLVGYQGKQPVLFDLGDFAVTRIDPPGSDAIPFTDMEGIWTASLDDHDRMLITAPYAISLWDLKTASQIKFVEERGGFMDAARLSPDGTKALIVDPYETVRIIDLDTGETLTEITVGNGGVMEVGISPDWKILATSDYEAIPTLWDAETGEELYRLPGTNDFPARFEFSTDSRIMMIDPGYGGREARVIDTRTGDQISAITEPLENTVTAAAMSASGTRVAVAAPSGDVFIYDVGNDVQPTATTTGGDQAQILTFSEDGSLLAGGAPDGGVMLWDANTGTLLHRMTDYPNQPYSLAISADNTRLLVGTIDGTVQLWDVATGQLFARLEGHDTHVTDVMFSNDDETAISISDDGTIRLWDGRKQLANMDRQALYELGCRQIARQGLDSFDLNSPMLSEMAPGGGELRHPCDRRGLLSAAWWAPTLKSWWADLIPGREVDEVAVTPEEP